MYPLVVVKNGSSVLEESKIAIFVAYKNRMYGSCTCQCYRNMKIKSFSVLYPKFIFKSLFSVTSIEK